MNIKTIIAILAIFGVAACSLPKMPSLPSLPSFGLENEGPEKRADVDCEDTKRLNLKDLDWTLAKVINLRLHDNRFTPKTMVMERNTGTIIRIFNGEEGLRTFFAKEFFRNAAIAQINYFGQAVSQTCIDAIRIGPKKWAEIKLVPLRQGDFLFGGEESIIPFSDDNKGGKIIVR
ncbi:MAG: hypothetical protein HQ512_12435 [Rhodospirillales bacterium]|nr:hypothetical protein [Rhodospirillales bacterium]